jgi:hypothetical protein
VFLQKSPQTIENKRNECEKERKERIRVRNSMKTMDLPQRHGDHRGGEALNRRARRVTPGGNADGYQNKGLPGKAIRMNMKTKGGGK